MVGGDLFLRTESRERETVDVGRRNGESIRGPISWLDEL